jgi:predicted nucleic acid-binding protein
LPAHEFAEGGVVLDASVLINLLATDRMREILLAVASRCVVTDQAYGEVCSHPREQPRVRRPGILDPAVASGVLFREAIPPDAVPAYLDLAGAGPPDDLGDGESATIAYALARQAVVLLDDTKAIGLCRRRFSGLKMMTTVELLKRPEVVRALGDAGAVDALFDALRFARMRVPHEHLAWARQVLGPERLALCPSLKRRPHPPGPPTVPAAGGRRRKVT